MKKLIQIILIVASLGVINANAQGTSSADAKTLATQALAGTADKDIPAKVKTLVGLNPSFAAEIILAAIEFAPSVTKSLIVGAASEAISVSQNLTLAQKNSLTEKIENLFKSSDQNILIETLRTVILNSGKTDITTAGTVPQTTAVFVSPPIVSSSNSSGGPRG